MKAPGSKADTGWRLVVVFLVGDIQSLIEVIQRVWLTASSDM
jgi:hypothetical protein